MKICVLGAGFVSSSVVHFLCEENKENGVTIIVASKVLEELRTLENKYPSITTIQLDVTTDTDKLKELMKGAGIVVSLLINEMHVPIAQLCIESKVHMVHASYCTREMLELDQMAKENGVTILSEIGLDPGIDHFLAMKAFDEIRSKGDKMITSFISYCGGLPEPKLSKSNPLGYKFSWSPRTALGNMLNPAKYLEGNKIIEIPPGGALIDTIEEVPFFPDLELEGYPNRNSLIYKDLYGIKEAENIIRGTLRYRGFGKILKALHKLGLLSSEPLKKKMEELKTESHSVPKSWKELILRLVVAAEKGRNTTEKIIPDEENVKKLLLLNGFDEEEVNGLENLGLLCGKTEVKLSDTLLDTLAEFLSPRLSFNEHERDIVIMRHEIKSKSLVNGEDEVREIDFIAYGDQHIGGFSAMSKTVGLTISYAAKLILNGEINRPGVIYPFTADIYEPILQQLESEGFNFTEKVYAK